MSEPRGLFHHKHKDDEIVVETTETYTSATVVDGKPVDFTAEIKKHSHKQHIGEAGALLGGAVAMMEKHQAKKHPEDAHKHHIGQAIAGAVAIGSGAYAVHEHHNKKDSKKESKHHH